MTDAEELIDCLLRRNDLLAVLCDEPMERYELVDRVDASKSTVYKGVSQLEDLGLIERTARGLEPTLFGTVAHERYRELAAAASFSPLLSLLPRDGPLDPDVLRGAAAITPTDHDVDRHFTHVERLLREADRVRGFTPIVSPRYVSIFAEQVGKGLRADLVLETDLVDRIAAADPRTLAALLAHENVSLYRTDSALPFGLAIGVSGGDEQVLVELRDRSTMTGVITNDSPDCRDWAERVYEEYRTTATPLQPADIDDLEAA